MYPTHAAVGDGNAGLMCDKFVVVLMQVRSYLWNKVKILGRSVVYIVQQKN